MSKEPENPPAFPGNDGPNANNPDFQTGMTLLDWFAGMALQGIIATEGVNVWDVPTDQAPLCARWAYGYAEAMIAERARRMP